MKIGFERAKPIYQQIIDRIVISIANGELPPGSKVGSVRDLAVEFGVNPNTVQKSLAKLGEMGYLRTERPGGRYVTDNLKFIEAARSRIPAELVRKFVDEMLDFGITACEIPEYVNSCIERLENDG